MVDGATGGIGELVLGIETSCDETAAAVVANGRRVLSSVVSSQTDLHARFGGVVPEVASRAHLERLIPVMERALSEASGEQLIPAAERAVSEVSGGRIIPSAERASSESSVTADRMPVMAEARDIAAVAATAGPGLVGALLVGVSAAKALSLVWDVPFVAVNHLEAHLHAVFLDEPRVEMPVIVVLVSGGHTMLVLMESRLRYRVLGATVDDAAGEAFDKVARHLGLGYPGGPAIDRLSKNGASDAIAFPRPMLRDGWNFSFSGLKTAVFTYLRRHPGTAPADIAASFQEAVADVLITKARKAAAAHRAKGVCLAGGVAANTRLRQLALERCPRDGLAVYLPSRAMCTDNAAMVAAAGWWRLHSDGPSPLTVGADPSLGLPDST